MTRHTEPDVGRIPRKGVIYEYWVWRNENGWHAQRVQRVTDRQRSHNVRQFITATSFNDLVHECMAQRIRASWFGPMITDDDE